MIDKADKPSRNDRVKTHVETVSRTGLLDVNRSLSLGGYTKELWNRLDFIVHDARSKAFRTTRNYHWWRFWLIASPVLEAVLYGTIFGLLLKTSRGIDNFVGFVILGMTTFNILSRMLQGGFGQLEANKSFLQAFNFPQAAVVFSTSLRYAMDTALPFYIAIVAALAFQPTEAVRPTVLLAVPLHLLLLLFGTGLMLFSARITASIPDTRALLDLFVRGWMFASGIFYPMDRFATDPVVFAVFTANPAYIFIDSVRQVTIEGSVPPLSVWGALLAWSFGALALGFVYFWLGEEKYAARL